MSISESFSEDGFLVFSEILSERELLDARAAVDRLHQRAISGSDAELTANCVFESTLPASKRGGALDIIRVSASTPIGVLALTE